VPELMAVPTSAQRVIMPTTGLCRRHCCSERFPLLKMSLGL
jgi:hypothetical protein